MSFFSVRAVTRLGLRCGVLATTGAIALLSGSLGSQAQGIDCGRLQAQIAQTGRGGGNYAKAARRQASELGRTQAYARQLGCDRGFSFFGGSQDPQCPGINARIAQMQANLGQLQASSGGGGREDLVARFNAYCRGAPQPPHERGFFESIFGSHDDPPPPPPQNIPPADDEPEEPGVGHGGSQAVCVRTCDGGFFPIGLSTHHSADSLNEMCSALCPGTEATVYTRSPDSEIKNAVSLDGKSYMDLPNALKYQKDFQPTCSCKPAGKTWAEALVNAEEILGNQRKGDILVTQEKSDELSRPKLDTKTRDLLLTTPGTTKVSPELAGNLVADPQSISKTEEVTGPDGVKRLVRRVGPQP